MKILPQLIEMRNLTAREIDTLIKVVGKKNVYLPLKKVSKK